LTGELIIRESGIKDDENDDFDEKSVNEHNPPTK